MSSKRAFSPLPFKPHWLFSNPHFQTIIPHLFRNAKKILYKRERFTLSGNDFIDLDWSTNNNSKLCIVLHGLESSAHRGYIYGMVHVLNQHKIDAVVINNRGCSGETNTHFASYNSGFTKDLEEVINHLNNLKKYSEINIIGFSLGGNVTLKLAGDKSKLMQKIINKVVAISVPCDLKATAIKLLDKSNKVYHDRFLKSLKGKLLLKQPHYPKRLKTDEIKQLKTLVEFDNYYTAPAFGFKDADDYYHKCSSKHYLKDIKNETLIITAQDDPFLTVQSMPTNECRNNKQITFINPEKGGHVGFMKKIKDERYWHEELIISFLLNNNRLK